MMLSVIAECLRDEGFIVTEDDAEKCPALLVSDMAENYCLQVYLENDGLRFCNDDTITWRTLSIDAPNAFKIIAAEINRLFSILEQNYSPQSTEPHCIQQESTPTLPPV